MGRRANIDRQMIDRRMDTHTWKYTKEIGIEIGVELEIEVISALKKNRAI